MADEMTGIELHGAHTVMQGIREGIARLDARRSTAKVELHDLEHQLASRRQELQGIEAVLSGQVHAARAEMAGTVAEHTKVQAALAERQAQFTAASEQVAGAQIFLAQVADERSRVETLLARKDEVAQAVEQAEVTLEALRQRLSTQQGFVDQALAQVQVLREEAAKIEEGTRNRREQLAEREEAALATSIKLAAHEDELKSQLDAVQRRMVALGQRTEDLNARETVIGQKLAEAMERQAKAEDIDRAVTNRLGIATDRENGLIQVQAQAEKARAEAALAVAAVEEREAAAEKLLAQAGAIRREQEHGAREARDRHDELEKQAQGLAAREQRMRDVSERLREAELNVQQVIRTNRLADAGIVVPSVPQD